MGHAICNGVEINFRCLGDGSDIVLIHGLAANQAFWQLQVLLTLAKSHRVTIYDLRGHGYSGMPPNGYDSATMAEDLHQLLDHLNLERAHLLGHSFGGVVALNYATFHPERVASLTVADARVRAFQPAHLSDDNGHRQENLTAFGFDLPEKEPEVGLWLLEQLASPKWQEERQRLKGSQFFLPFGGWNGGQRTAERWLELLNETSAKEEITAQSGPSIDKLTHLQQPTLAVYGERSTTIPSMEGLKKTLVNCKSVVVPEAGHFFPLTQPKNFVNLVSKFLEESESKVWRRFIRLPLKIAVQLRVAGIQYSGVTVNVSQNGLLVETIAHNLEPGSLIEIILDTSELNPAIASIGKVVRVEKTGNQKPYRYGIELLDFEQWMDECQAGSIISSSKSLWNFLKEKEREAA